MFLLLMKMRILNGKNFHIYMKFTFSSKHNTLNFYELLGVSLTATDEEIKKGYFKKAKELHPDASQNVEGGSEDFKRVSEAYSILKDPLSRERYNREYLGNFADEQGKVYTQHTKHHDYRYDWYRDRQQEEPQNMQGDSESNHKFAYNKWSNAEANRQFYRNNGDYYTRTKESSKKNGFQEQYQEGSFKSEFHQVPQWRRWKLHWLAGIGVLFLIEQELQLRFRKNKKTESEQISDKDVIPNKLINPSDTMIHAQEIVKQQSEKELQDQDVKIEMSYLNLSQATNPYQQRKDKIKLYKQKQELYSGQNSLLEFAKNEKVSIFKTPEALERQKKSNKSRRISLQQLTNLAEEEYV